MRDRVIHLLPGEPFPETPGVSRILFGAEWCPHLAPTRREVEEARGVAAERGLAFALVLPWLPPAGLAGATEALAGLRPGDEAVVNDWGMLALLAGSPGTVPVLGRLPAAGMALPGGARGGALAAASFNRMLAGLGISRVHADAVIGLPGEGCDRQIEWHRRPLVTLTRRCPWRMRRGRWESGPCPRHCLGRRLALERRDDRLAFAMDGSATFGPQAGAPDDPRIDRVVERAGEESR